MIWLFPFHAIAWQFALALFMPPRPPCQIIKFKPRKPRRHS